MNILILGITILWLLAIAVMTFISYAEDVGGNDPFIAHLFVGAVAATIVFALLGVLSIGLMLIIRGLTSMGALV